MFWHNVHLRKRRPSSPPVFGRGGEKPPPLPKWEGRREASSSPPENGRGSPKVPGSGCHSHQLLTRPLPFRGISMVWPGVHSCPAITVDGQVCQRLVRSKHSNTVLGMWWWPPRPHSLEGQPGMHSRGDGACCLPSCVVAYLFSLSGIEPRFQSYRHLKDTSLSHKTARPSQGPAGIDLIKSLFPAGQVLALDACISSRIETVLGIIKGFVTV